MVKIKIQIQKGTDILSLETENVNTALSFLTKYGKDYGNAETQKPANVPIQKAEVKIQKKERATPAQTSKLNEILSSIAEEYGQEMLDAILKEEDIKTENMTPKQIRRAYAILRKRFPEFFDR